MVAEVSFYAFKWIMGVIVVCVILIVLWTLLIDGGSE